MVVKLRKMAVSVTLALGLVAGLFGVAMDMQAMPLLQHNVPNHSSRLLANGPGHVCPPPPYAC